MLNVEDPTFELWLHGLFVSKTYTITYSLIIFCFFFLQLEEVMFENRLNRGQKDYTYLHDNRLISLNNRLTQLVNQVGKKTSLVRYVFFKNVTIVLFQFFQIFIDITRIFGMNSIFYKKRHVLLKFLSGKYFQTLEVNTPNGVFFELR